MKDKPFVQGAGSFPVKPRWYARRSVLVIAVGCMLIGCRLGVAAVRTAEAWKRIQLTEALDLYIKGQLVGTFNRTLAVQESGATVSVENNVAVGNEASSPAAQRMRLVERRTYGFDGALISAHQELTSSSGKTVWDLARERSTGWKLAIVTGGVERAKHVANVPDNLSMTYLLYSGVKSGSLKAGDTLRDTTFDLTSSETVTQTTRCVETPRRENGLSWTFRSVNSMTGFDERWSIDSSGRTLYEEMEQFTAKKKNDGSKESVTNRVSTPLYEAFAVPVSRPQRDGESIRVTFDAAVTPDSSVAQFYRKSENAWVVHSIPHECRKISSRAVKEDSLQKFTAATATMQSDDARLRRLADSLVSKSADRCDSIGACFRYVFKTLEKRYTATFSNALETLAARSGDCGEHAVLLGALLRAVRIPARVALGLVYVRERQCYLYHVWVMARSGGAWVFVDPALGVFPAVRDRVPLILDDTGESMVRLVKIIGRIKIDYAPAE